MNSYIRIGEQSVDSFYKPCHVVEYYKYLRFFTDGKIILLFLPCLPFCLICPKHVSDPTEYRLKEEFVICLQVYI